MKFDLAAHPETGLTAPGSPQHLVITDPLPNVCSRHGREAVERREGQVTFYATRRGGRQVTFVRLLWKLIQIWRLTVVEHIGPEIVLHGEWPVCSSCLRTGRIYRRMGAALIALAALTWYSSSCRVSGRRNGRCSSSCRGGFRSGCSSPWACSEREKHSFVRKSPRICGRSTSKRTNDSPLPPSGFSMEATRVRSNRETRLHTHSSAPGITKVY